MKFLIIMNKIKIGIFEFDYHPEVLRNTISILNTNEYEIYVFSRKHIIEKSRIQTDHIEVNSLNKNQSLKTYINNHLDKINSLDLLLFNTIASNFKTFSKTTFKPSVILRIHNSNAYFNTLKNTYRPIFQAFYIWKDFSHFVRNTLYKRDIYWRNKLLKKIDYFAFPNEIIKDYSINHLDVSLHKTLNLPFSFYLEDIAKTDYHSKEISISIIGKIDKRNRDYYSVIKAFEKLNSFINENKFIINLFLLGDSNSLFGKKILRKFEKLRSKKLRIHSFKGFVENQKFKEVISKTDFLLSPVKVATRFTIYKEFYGKTKISGSLNDILLFQKPAIIPNELSIPNEYKTVTESYSNADQLSTILKDWISGNKYNDFNFDNLNQNYRLEIIQKLYLENFHKILRESISPKDE